MPEPGPSESVVAGVGVGVVDVAVHPVPSSEGEFRSHLAEPWRDLRFPGPVRYLYPPPSESPLTGAFLESTRRPEGVPGSDARVVGEDLDSRGVSTAVLVPLTRGLNANLDLGSQICAATNDWLAEAWLSRDDRFRGSIRINPEDDEAAVAEIERWAGDARMVQIAVPLESHAPYGQRRYRRVWEAAAHHHLPVAIHADGGAGTSYWPTANGYPRLFIEFNSLYSMNFIYHLTSLIAEGVFERLASSRFVFGDGGHDILLPLMWRMDMDWPIAGLEVPWMQQCPSDYLKDHVRFVASRFEGPTTDEGLDEWVAMSDAYDLLMFGSHYPHWLTLDSGDLHPGADARDRSRLLADNAHDFLRFQA